MNKKTLTFSVFLASVFTGLLLSASLHMGTEGLPSIDPILHGDTKSSDGFRAGSADEHAFFWIVENGSERNLDTERFRSGSDYVYLGNRSSIVNKKAEGVTWQDFLETINTTVNTTGEESICLTVFGNRSCGEGAVYLDGERVESFDREIEQGDNFLIILRTQNWREKAQGYMVRQLPRNYKPERSRGRRV